MGSETFPWVLRARRLARLCAELDRPDVLGAIMGAVASLPLTVEEVRGLRDWSCRSVWSPTCGHGDCGSIGTSPALRASNMY